MKVVAFNSDNEFAAGACTYPFPNKQKIKRRIHQIIMKAWEKSSIAIKLYL